MRNLKKYFDALRILGRVPSHAIEGSMINILEDIRDASEDKRPMRASGDDRNLVENILRAVIDIAKADEAAAEKAGKADKP